MLTARRELTNRRGLARSFATEPLLSSTYLVITLKRASLFNPEKRPLCFRFFPTQLQSFFGNKPVLGLLVTLVFFDKYERFDEQGLLTTIQKWIPDACIVQSSRYLFQHPQEEKVCTLYVEFDKKDGALFSFKERQLLKKVLAQEIKERIEKMMPPLFTVRNEEQVMKHIIHLSQELKNSTCLPQLIISFEKQKPASLVFTIIIVYISKSQKFEEGLSWLCQLHEVSLERKEIVGFLEEGLAKEALVFRLQIPKTQEMLRGDFSVNVHLARQKVYYAISAAFGEMRDYDGGLILKQQELFSRLEERFRKNANEKRELLENFFYSISPIERQATLPLCILETLFSLMLDSMQEVLTKKGSYYYKIVEKEKSLIIFIRAESATLKKYLSRHLDPSLFGKQLTTTLFFYQETLCLGFVLDTLDQKNRQLMLERLHAALETWQTEIRQFQVLKLNFLDHPISLDPRLAGDSVSSVITQLLFEGLMRKGTNGIPDFAIASSYEISNDLKTYFFYLRSCAWSNGTPVRAYDFEYAWKKIISPSFKSPFIHYFYPIKNAWAAKEGLIPLNEVGVQAINEQTLRIDLEHPLPYFLELLALPLFSPINAAIDSAYPLWAKAEEEFFVCNGPFSIKKNRRDNGYLLEKNPNYWNAKNVYLHQVVLTKANETATIQMFNNGDLDWIGRPMSPWEFAYEQPKKVKFDELYLGDRVYWCSLNVKSPVLQSKKLRQALSLAISRQEIVEEIKDGTPAFSLLPPPHACFPHEGNKKGEPHTALELFDEALEELNLSKKRLPTLNMIFPRGDKREKITKIICDQWKKNLGIEVFFQGFELKELFEKITAGNYEIAGISWISPVNDPLYTLNIFKAADDPLNFPKWENPDFQELIEMAMHETQPTQRKNFLAKSEKFLNKELPVIPILYEKEYALKKSNLNVYLESGHVDFKSATFNH